MLSKLKVKYFIVGARPNSTSQTCQPRCRLGQCCMDGKCLCIDPATFQVDDCGCMLNYLYEVNYIVFMVHCYMIIYFLKVGSQLAIANTQYSYMSIADVCSYFIS